MTTAWQAPYRAPQRVQWLLFSRLAHVVMGIALVTDLIVLLLAGSTELSLTLHPRPVGWIAALAIGPIFFVVFLTQLLVILTVPARVAARLDRPYEKAFRQNDLGAFVFGLIGPGLPLVVRVVEGLIFFAALVNLTVVAGDRTPRLRPPAIRMPPGSTQPLRHRARLSPLPASWHSSRPCTRS